MIQKRLLIFAIILTFLCTLGSIYALKKDSKPHEMHTPQRKIERQLSHQDMTSFKHSQIERILK